MFITKGMAEKLGVVLAIVITVASDTASAQQRIDQLRGYVSAQNIDRFAALIADHLDRIIGLQVYIDAGETDGMSADADDRMFVVYKVGGDFEIVATSGYRYEHGGYVFDGCFIVKSGGVHQGVVSYGLQQIDEAQVLLTPGIEIIPLPLE